MEDLNEFDSLRSEVETRPSPTKQPFKRLEIAVNRVIKLAIPLHVQTLKKQCENIENLQARGEWTLLQSEQINASNTVRLLKSDIYELESLNVQVRPEDVELFQKKIQFPTQEVVEALASFLDSHANIMQPLPDYLENKSSAKNNPKFPVLVCRLEEDAEVESDNVLGTQTISNVLKSEEVVEHSKVSKHWSKLKNDLLELNELIRKFASLVFSQKESVNRIEDNIQQTHANVQAGTKHLKKAAILQAATFPVAGAVVGGLLLGPVGALAGFKLFGSVACAVSGSVLGYGAGVKYKRQRQISCDVEMKALTYPSKSRSISNPDLLSVSENIVSNPSNTTELKNK